jgi:lipopolysaccharide transport system permease protein
MDSSRPPDHASAVCTVIQAADTDPWLELRELWRARELLGFLAWRDLRVRYRQTLLGAAWALLEPFVGVLLFTLVFNRLAGLQSGSVPYPLYCYAGLVLWTFFGRSLRTTCVSLVANAGLITKAYFPRLVLPLAGQLATVVDFGCALAMYFVLLAYYGIAPTPAILTVPLWVMLAALNALGIGLALAAVNVRFRDVSQTVPFLVQVWMLATPVAYPLSAVPARWMSVYQLNPMVGVVEGMRWALLPGHTFDVRLLIPSLGIGLVLLVIGLALFRRTQRRFADIV